MDSPSQTPAPRHNDITQKIREAILRGGFAPGTLLPTIRELAEQYGTSNFTVQTALKPLVEEGLLEPKRRVGTMVRHSMATFSSAAIYLGHDVVGGWDFAFHRELCNQLRIHLEARGIQPQVFVDMRPEQAKTQPLPALLSAVELHHVQALFVPLSNQFNQPWLERLPVATSFVTSAPRIANRVVSDFEQIIRCGVAQLRHRGCTRVGLISFGRPPPNMPASFPDIRAMFRERVAEFGLTTREEWIAMPEDRISHEAFGYEAFKTLWRQRDRPEGLLVHTDITARGAMTALLELGVQVPEELKLVFHRNRGLDWHCPLKLDVLECDVSRWAVEMIRQVLLLRAGEAVEPVLQPCVLKPGY